MASIRLNFAAVSLFLSLILFLAKSCLSAQHYRASQRSRISGSYFVHLHPAVDSTGMQTLVDELHALSDDENEVDFKAKVLGTVTEAAHGFTAKLSSTAVEKLLNNKLVKAVEEDQYVYAGSVASRTVHSWGLDNIDAAPNDSRFTPPCSLSGSGVDIYVVDSGLRYSHVELSGHAHYPQCDPIDELEGESKRGGDCTGHGTHVAGTIAGNTSGIAPGANLFSIRVLNCRGSGSATAIIHGIECILSHSQARSRPAIVNLSIYGGKIRSIKRAVEKLIKRGITVVGIAGNAELHSKPKDSCRLSPSAIPGVFTVSASTQGNNMYEMTNVGMCVDIFAPGENIRSASNACDSCYKSRSGSSMAAPHVTGSAALLLQRCPYLPPWRVKHAILTHLAQVDVLDSRTIPRRLRKSTANLLLHLSSALCSVEC